MALLAPRTLPVPAILLSSSSRICSINVFGMGGSRSSDCQRSSDLQSRRQPSSPLNQISSRGAKGLTRAEKEDLKGIPVRLLRDVNKFGRKHAIIRVKPGRMRNVWHYAGVAEYMTRERFVELGLTKAAIGVRDRTFGTRILKKLKDDSAKEKGQESTAILDAVKITGGKQEGLAAALGEAGGSSSSSSSSGSIGAEERAAAIHDLLATALPPILVFPRKPIPTSTPATPSTPAPPARSPSLAANADILSSLTSTDDEPAQPIYGSVSAADVLARIQQLLASESRTVGMIKESDVRILGLQEDDAGRIKRLGRYEVEIGKGSGDGAAGFRITVEVVAEGEREVAEVGAVGVDGQGSTEGKGTPLEEVVVAAEGAKKGAEAKVG